jgi:hypothetical protein
MKIARATGSTTCVSAATWRSGWANEGSQLHLSSNTDESEPELGWSNTGPQLRLSDGYALGNVRESDGDCDAEDDDTGGDVLDQGEFDLRPW